MIVPVTDNGTPHHVAIWWGTGTTSNIDMNYVYVSSAKYFTEVSEKYKVDIEMSAHAWVDPSFERMDALRSRKPGEPHPFVIGQEKYQQYQRIFIANGEAEIAKIPMCKILKISRSTYYSYEEPEKKKDKINDIVVKIFNQNQHVYGTRKLKAELAKRNYKLSRRRIARIMRYNGLISAYTIKKYRPHKETVNNEAYPNLLERQFDEKDPYEVVVSDLTYVRVGND
ncbi:MAG: family transposase [Firmicutes bacterium]|nr:family transposase [Bacillota bacterium]